MSAQPLQSTDVYQRARQMARELGTPVYISAGEATLQRPAKTSAMIWPNGSVTWGNASGSDRRDRRHAA